jgi:hypothetical protein
MNQMQMPGQMPGQSPMPGQAQGIQQVLPGMQGPQGGPPQAPSGIGTSILSKMSPQELVRLEQDPNAMIRNNISLHQIIAAKAEAIKNAQMAAANQRQQAMAAGAAPQTTVKQDIDNQFAQVMTPQEPVMAAYGGEMHGYAGGGAVAFAGGGFLGYNRDYEDARRLGIDLSPYDAPAVRAEKLERLKKMREFEKSMAANRAEIPVDTSKLFPGGPPEVRMPIPEIEVAPPAPRPPSATRPGTGIAQGQNRPQAAPAESGIASLMGPPAPDRLSQLEADERARVEGLQKILASQGQVDPRIVAARREAADFAQKSLAEREKRATGALEAAGMPLSQGLINNQEALLRIAGAFGSGKRFAQSAAAAAREAGGIRGEQRKAFETAQRENRLEQDALDKLRQAQLDLKVAQETGDVQGERAAVLKVEEAKANLGLTRMNILKEQGTQEDRAKQRAIEEKRIATTVSEGALDRASRERLAKAAQTGDSRRVFDTLMDNARAEFEKWEKSPEGARVAMNPQAKEAKRVEFLEKQVALAKAAGIQGLDPLLAAVRSPQAGAGSTGRVVDFSSIK